MSDIPENSELESLNRIKSFLIPLDEAVAELRHRRTDTELQIKINEFLNGDIPNHFKNGPIFYLSRHVASPNFEALRFIELCKEYKDIKMVIGQDINDKFVSHNSMKRALGKMPIVKGITSNQDEIIEFITLVDFDKVQGQKFKDIKTKFGTSFVEHHNNLFNSIYPETVQIVDDSKWIDNNHRGDLVEHYKKMFTLLLVHGIMLESYEIQDEQFIKSILIPALEYVENMFGYKPLIVNLVPPEISNMHNWDSYPSVLYQIVKRGFENDSNK